MVALHYSLLHRFDIFSAPRTIAHGSIRLPPRSLAKTRGCSLAIKRTQCFVTLFICLVTRIKVNPLKLALKYITDIQIQKL